MHVPAIVAPVVVVLAQVRALEAQTRKAALVEAGLCMGLFVSNGILGRAVMVKSANAGTYVRRAPIRESLGRSIRLLLMIAQVAFQRRRFSGCEDSSLPSLVGGKKWQVGDFLEAHDRIRRSNKHNFEFCKIPVPTAIRHDRLRLALGDRVTTKEERILSLLEFGFPINCVGNFGIRKPQKNHFSALAFKSEIGEYFAKSIETQALLGPFESAPIPDLCFSPLMSVPKECSKRRVIVDFSFPPGKAINDGIPRSTYLDFEIQFSLPSVRSMIDRINTLGSGCLMFKRDLKGAFRQFSVDPGDYKFTGLCWENRIYVDTRLAMGLRSSAFCCQSVTEILAKIAGEKAFILVYLDDFGGAELASNAYTAFNMLGSLLEFFGFQEAVDKAVPPTTHMDWLGISLDTIEWTMALKPGKREELLLWLPKLLTLKRVRKDLLQKILGNLVWASAVVRAGAIFFNRLLALLRKLKRPNHSIYFSRESKKDVSWWFATLEKLEGKAPIPPSVWTPLSLFYTDASLEGYGLGQQGVSWVISYGI